MSDRSGSSHLRVLFEAALEDYEHQTGIELANHPLAGRLQVGDSIEYVIAILREQAQDFERFREKDKVLKPLKKVLTVLHKLSSAANLAQDVGMHLPPAKAIQTGLGILLAAVKGATDDYSALADLLESIGQFFNRLEIYTEITPTKTMSETLVKILVELLSTLALTANEAKQGKLGKLVGKFVGEKKMEAMVQRLDRLTQDEAKQAVAEILKVVHGLFGNMKVVMNDGKVSIDNLMKSLEIMHQVAGDLNKAKRDDLQGKIHGWLLPPDPWQNHHGARKLHHRGTAEWFVQDERFLEWKTSDIPGSILWVHGKPGAGKSVLCYAIVEDIRAMQKAGLASLAFFYCDFKEDRKKELRGLLSSFLVQLCHQSDSYFDILSNFYAEHNKGLRPAANDALVECLKDLLTLRGLAPVYLIVDALDECPNPSVIRSPRAEVLSLIKELVKTENLKLRVCVTSRPELDIKDVLDPLIFRSISLHDESGQKRDIEDYIKSVINTRTTKRWKEEHRKLAIDVLIKKSNGMFRWVDCQMVHICDCIPARIRLALAELPETLDETYERTLRGINKANWEFAYRMFQFVSVASRPLRVEELADLLAFDFEAGSIPEFYEDWRLEDPADAVLSTCSTLLAIVDNQGSPIIQFSHFSVKEFLTSTRLAEASDIISCRYHISMTPAHTLVAQACLGILLHLDEDITGDSLEDFPLAEYAAEYWLDHTRFEGVSRNVEDGLKQLFDPRKLHLAICVWICNPEGPRQMGRKRRPLPLPRTSLHYAASWGLHPVVKFLIIDRSQDVSSRDSTDNATPLHLALRNRHVEAACKLIEHGADLTAQTNDGLTPLNLALQKGQVDVARMLIERGANLTAQNNDGLTPLHLALQTGQVNVARMLIERDAALTAQTKDGVTALHLALQTGQVDVARMLIERGAGLTARTNSGETAIHLALQKGQVDVARMLIERGADLTSRDNDGETPLHLASSWGQVDVARMLIERGADPTAQNNNASTPLHLAGQVDVARMLVERGADMTAQNGDGSTPLHLALQTGQVDVARMLIECGAGLAAQTNDGSTPLHLALQRGQVDFARMLIERGACLTAQTNDGSTPLHVVLQKGQVDVARWLIERGAAQTSQTNDGSTPLHLALQNGQVDVACVLIERGTNLTAQDNDGLTPLHLALQEGQVDVACMLIERGVDLEAQDNHGSTPLHFASQERQTDVVRLLIDRGADLAAQNNHGSTPLHLALRKGEVHVTRMLIEQGADLKAQDNYGSTPLHLALQNGQVDIACMLIERGTNLKAQDNDGLTPLHLASQKGQVRVARVLIELGADLTAQNNHGSTPLHLALRKGKVHAARMLIEQGADPTAQDNNGWTPLHLASQRGKVHIARKLIERGANLTAQNNDGDTPLHLASAPPSWAQNLQQKYAKVVHMLLEHGAEVNALNKEGSTPFVLASRGRLTEIIHIYVQHGANSGAPGDAS